MATLTERLESRAYNSDGSVTLIYDLRDAGSNTVAAYAALLASTGTTFEDRVRESHPTMEPVYVDENEDVGHYYCTVQYIPAKTVRAAVAEVQVRIYTLSRTTRLTQAYAHISSNGTNPPAHAGAIGVTDDGPEGVDVVDPAVGITVTRRYLPAGMPTTATLLGLRGKVNSDATTIKDTRKAVGGRSWVLAIGELLCVGVDEGTIDDDGLITVTYQFEAAPNRAAVTVGAVGPFAVKGHEYLWVQYGKVASGDGAARAPRWAYVEQIYETTAMNALGLDGT